MSKVGSFVEGVLYEVDDATLTRIDQKEGVPKTYQRHKVKVKDMEGKTYDDVVTYVAPAGRGGSQGKPRRKYMEHLLKGAEAFGLTDAYRERIKGVATQD
jgi:gamma-glutamylcyclotransferase (GGCT)/AIG2-like uncharacterized protein YtfP